LLLPKNQAEPVKHLGQFWISTPPLSGSVFGQRQQRVTLELFNRSSRAAEQLIPVAVERLSANLRIDRHQLLRKHKHLLHKSDIPAAKHLATLQAASKFAQRVLKEEKTEAEGEVTRLTHLFEAAVVKCAALEDELLVFIERLSPGNEPAKWSSYFESDRTDFFKKLRTLAKKQWPKSTKFDKAVCAKSSIALALVAAAEKDGTIRERLQDLDRRIEAVGRISRAAAIERKLLRAKQEEIVESRSATAKWEAGLAVEKEKEYKRQAEHLKVVQESLDRENALVIETAKKLSSGATLLDVVEDLYARGFEDAAEITYRATLYLRNMASST